MQDSSWAKLAVWTVGKAFEVVLEVVRGAFEAGITLTQLIVETAIHPDQAMDNLLKAARQLGQTMTRLYNRWWMPAKNSSTNL